MIIFCPDRQRNEGELRTTWPPAEGRISMSVRWIDGRFDVSARLAIAFCAMKESELFELPNSVGLAGGVLVLFTLATLFAAAAGVIVAGTSGSTIVAAGVRAPTFATALLRLGEGDLHGLGDTGRATGR